MLKSAIIFSAALTVFVGCGPAAAARTRERAPLVQGESVGVRQGTAPVFAKRWTLTGLGGRRLGAGAPYLEFDAEQGRFSGSSGCNSIFGGYRADGARLRFTTVGATRRMCVDPERQKVEAAFLKALERTTRFRVRGTVVSMYAGDELVLTFRAGRRP